MEKDIQCVNIDGVVKLTGFKKATIYKHLRLRNFPQPIKLGAATRWRVATIHRWIEEQEERSQVEDSRIAELSRV
jgi:predicted DNA-binding transcriptional regulator AlpA